MKIVVVGGGKIGFTLTEQLSAEGHEVTLVDNNPRAIDHASNLLDVLCILGNGAAHSILMEAGVNKADLLIASTGSDELNMLCCLIGKKTGARHTIARVRNPEYVEQLVFMREELGLSMYINPEYAAAEEIFRMLRMPSAIKIDTFANRRVELVEMKVGEKTGLDNISLRDFTRKYRIKALVCAVQRGNEVHIPSGDTVIRHGDMVSVIAAPPDIEAFFAVLGAHHRQVHRVMIVGGSRIAFYLSRMLTNIGMETTIIESDSRRCMELCELLQDHKVIVINGDGTDQSLLHEEGIDNIDAFVSLTGVDEENIIVSLYAHSLNVGKVITKLNRPNLMGLIRNVGLESFVSPRDIIASLIVTYARAMENSLGSNVETLHRIVSGQIEALEFSAKSSLPFLGVTLKDLELKPNVLIGCISRGRETIIPGGADSIQLGDRVIVISEKGRFSDLKDIQKD